MQLGDQFVKRMAKISIYLFLLISLLVILSPFVWLLLSSFKNNIEILTRSPLSIPKIFRWENYAYAWGKAKFSTYLRNSLLVTSVSVAGILFVSSLAGFAFGRLNFWGKNPIFLVLLSGLMIPVQIVLIPLFILLKEANMLDTYQALIFPYIAFNLPLSIFVLTGVFTDLPKELESAAKLDGCSEFGIFWRIMLPLTRPTLAALGLLNFIWIWNEFLFAFCFIYKEEYKIVSLGLMYFSGKQYANYGAMSAAVFLSLIPIFIIYMFFHKYVIRGLVAGALKG